MSLTNIKITPLSIVTALCVFYTGLFLLDNEKPLTVPDSFSQALYTFILAVVLFVTDILFRRLVSNMRWIWLIQSSFIVIIVIMILIFKKI